MKTTLTGTLRIAGLGSDLYATIFGADLAAICEDVGPLKRVTVQKAKSMGRYPGSAPIEEEWAAAEASVNIDEL